MTVVFGATLPGVRYDGSAVPRSPGRTWSSLLVPPIEMGERGSEAVRAIFLQFDQQAQRRRSILRLALVAVMARGTSRANDLLSSRCLRFFRSSSRRRPGTAQR